MVDSRLVYVVYGRLLMAMGSWLVVVVDIRLVNVTICRLIDVVDSVLLDVGYFTVCHIFITIVHYY